MKNKISEAEYMESAGLMSLARTFYDQVCAVEKQLAQKLGVPGGEDGYYSHVSDAIWSGTFDFDKTLEKLGITKPEGVKND